LEAETGKCRTTNVFSTFHIPTVSLYLIGQKCKISAAQLSKNTKFFTDEEQKIAIFF
jgi:hypothetical protein